jgi:UDP-glucuronate 4-epimerase
MNVLITGSAGFIGFHLVKKFISEGYNITGIDNINDYYEVSLKHNRLLNCGIGIVDVRYNFPVKSKIWPNYTFIKINLEDTASIISLFETSKFDIVINLAAQAGVRYSLENPWSYIHSNVTGFLNILEGCKSSGVKKIVYASSSSVYGLSENFLLSETDNTDFPVSIYAASKKSNELMAYCYSHLYNIQTIGLRFFTVYGPWGRPDMAPFIFTNAILKNKELNIFNNGKMQRDFTYIDDIVEGIYSISIKSVSKRNVIFNIGNNKPVKLLDFIKCIEKELKISGFFKYMPMQPGDVVNTYANIDLIKKETGFSPKTRIDEGVREFIEWFLNYYK